MQTIQSRTMTSVFGLALAAMAPVAAQAQVTQDTVSESAPSSEIVVTAQRRQERSVDVPITVTTLSQEALATANVQELRDISKITPSLRFDSQAAFVQPTIRGIGTGITTSGGGSNVGIYVDGFYSPNPLAASFDLLNVTSIQVLKGPQGTLFGRNTTGGAILVQTAEPSTDTGGQVKVGYGRFNQFRAQGYLTYGISETVALDMEGLYRSGDGFVRDIADGSKDGKFENYSVRFGLKADLSDNVSVLLRYQHNNVDDPSTMLTNSNVDSSIDPTTGQPFGIQTRQVPGTFTTDPDRYAPGPDKVFVHSKTDIFQGTIKADLDFADLTSYSQYRTEKVNQSQNLDQVGLTVFQLGLPIDNETWSQEFLLTSKPGTPLQWTAGLFYFSNRDTYRTFIDNFVSAGAGRVPLGGSSTTTKSLAAFLDGTYEINPQLFVTAGLRYSHDWITDAYYITPLSGTRTYVTNEQKDAVDDHRVTPRIVIRYKPTEESSVYASYTKGYKAGILDVGGSTGNPVKPEKIDAFEVGFKYDDRGLSFEAAAFYYDYKDLQVSIFRDATAQIVNAATSEIYGLEGQVRYSFNDNFDVYAGAGWTHARYKEFVNAPVYASCPAVPAPGTCTGGQIFYVDTSTTLRDVTMQRTPEFTGNIGARYATDLGGGELALSGNFYYTSHFFFSPSGTQFRQGAYEVLSLRAEWTDPSDSFTLAVFGDNITDSRYRTQVQYNNFGIGSTYSAPTTYGVEGRFRF